jgi:NAD(P)H-hydrate epimerase
MRKAFSVKQAQRLDRFAIQKLGIPSIVLMENAGRETAQEILRILKNKKKKSVCIFCGTGNNGGDGFVVARHLFNHGIKIKVFVIGKPQDLKKDPEINYQILNKLKCPVEPIQSVNKKVLKDLDRSDVVVDAIFGIGLSRQIAEPFQSIIEAINQSKKTVVAVDVPSGLDATTGKTFGTCIKASLTTTFAVVKKGFLTKQGRFFTGKMILADIGIPKKIIQVKFSGSTDGS